MSDGQVRSKVQIIADFLREKGCVVNLDGYRIFNPNEVDRQVSFEKDEPLDCDCGEPKLCVSSDTTRCPDFEYSGMSSRSIFTMYQSGAMTEPSFNCKYSVIRINYYPERSGGEVTGWSSRKEPAKSMSCSLFHDAEDLPIKFGGACNAEAVKTVVMALEDPSRTGLDFSKSEKMAIDELRTKLENAPD